MILQFDDGRELELPDDMPDETARQLKRLIQAHEERTRAAEAEVRAVRDELATLRVHMNSVSDKQNTDTFVANAIANMHQELTHMLNKVHAAVSADREIVPNEFGDMTRSRIVR